MIGENVDPMQWIQSQSKVSAVPFRSSRFGLSSTSGNLKIPMTHNSMGDNMRHF